MDLSKLLNGHNQVRVYGECNTPRREALIEEAVRYFQENSTPTREEYFGIKNYAGFGDQREDYIPGYGPRHGTIVFRVDYVRPQREEPTTVVDGDGIYYLLTALANPSIDLSRAIDDYLAASDRFEECKATLEGLGEFNMHAEGEAA